MRLKGWGITPGQEHLCTGCSVENEVLNSLGNLSLVVSQRPILPGGVSGSLGRSGSHLPAQDADPINFSRRKRASGSLAHLQITRSK